MSRKWLLGGALALVATLGAAQAQAHSQVQWSISVGAPMVGAVISSPVYAPAPVYVAPAPVYVSPAPVYAPAYGSWRAPAYRGGYQHPTRWDADGDGIPNRYDRVYNPRWDRDGDGIPDRYDHHWGRGR